MKEVEVKVLEIDVAKASRAIKRAGGRLVLPRTLFREWFFSFIKGKSRFSSLRLRQEGKKAVLAMKVRERSKQVKITEETEVIVSDILATRKIFESMGYRVFRTREKYRTGFKLGSCKIELDEYPGIPAYLEIEGQTIAAVKECMNKLGLDPKQTVAMSATEVLEKVYGKGPNLVF